MYSFWAGIFYKYQMLYVQFLSWYLLQIPDAVCTVFWAGICYKYQMLYVQFLSWYLLQIPDAVCTVFEFLMIGRETTWNMQSFDNSKEYCIMLHIVGYA